MVNLHLKLSKAACGVMLCAGTHFQTSISCVVEEKVFCINIKHNVTQRIALWAGCWVVCDEIEPCWVLYSKQFLFSQPFFALRQCLRINFRSISDTVPVHCGGHALMLIVKINESRCVRQMWTFLPFARAVCEICVFSFGQGTYRKVIRWWI